MKTMLIGLSIIGLTNLVSAQENTRDFSHAQLKEIENAPIPNQNYFIAVNDKHSSHHVQLLEKEASKFDITKSEIFNNTYRTYSMLFSTTNGNIVASYDESGELLNCVEKFENVLPPNIVMQTVMTKYPGWTLNSTAYRVNYYRGQNVKKVYQLQIKKDDDRINLKIDCQGVILRQKRHTE